MNKRVRRVFIKIFCVLAILVVFSSNMMYVFGEGNFGTDGFEGKTNDEMQTGIAKGFGSALSVIRIAGTGIAVIALLIIGIRYMISSPGQRADYKKNLIGFTIGAFILMGASQLLGLIDTASGQIIGGE